MFSSVTEKEVKKSIQQAFTEPGGPLRVIIATIAFGMGLDCPDIRRIYHLGTIWRCRELYPGGGKSWSR